jgi:hypothetical protein
MNIPEAQFESWMENSKEWAGLFKDFKFAPRQELLPVKFYPQDTLAHTMKLIQKHGRQGVLRTRCTMTGCGRRLTLLHRNGKINLLPYFFIDEEVVDLHQRAGELTGPGPWFRRRPAALLPAGDHARRPAAVRAVDGPLHDPRPHQVRQDARHRPGLPHRDLLVDEVHPENGWLVKRFGDHVVQISTDMTIRMRQGVLDVHRIRAPDRKVPPEVAALTKQFQKPPRASTTTITASGTTTTVNGWRAPSNGTRH